MSKFSSSTSVNQASQNQTTVTVENQIANIIDVQVIADALKATAGQTQELIASLSKAQIITQLGEVKARMEQNEILKNGIKWAFIGAGIWFIGRKIYG